MVESPIFDVFLCHNGKDKPEVREIALQLQQQGIKPWLDEWELRPGLSWQELLEDQIEQIKTAAVFVGSSGLGPWQKREMRAFLSEFVNRNCPVIPVLLKSAPQEPRLPIFLKGMTWVDFRRAESNPLARLNWGITGVKPDRLIFAQPLTTNVQQSVSSSVKQNNPTSQSHKSPKMQIARFEMITVDARGKEIERKPSTAEYFIEDLGDHVALDMVAIPGGKFLMGTDDAEVKRLNKKYDTDWFNNEQPQHEVTVPPFFMGRYPVTQAQWRVIASRTDLKVELDLDPNPAYFKDQADSKHRPVERVSWYDAVEFCQRLSKLSNDKYQYRLPSEAEWEYACRSVNSQQYHKGITSTVNSEELTLAEWNRKHHQPFHFGETITTNLANYDGNYTYANEPKGKYREQTTPVGNFPPNAFGLYDMHGNVWEWCADTWHDNYQDAPDDGSPWRTDGNDNFSPLRGGSWSGNPDYCRSASRSFLISWRDLILDYVGFRVVCDFS